MRKSLVPASEDVLRLAVETVRSACVPVIRVAQGDPDWKSRRALGRGGAQVRIARFPNPGRLFTAPL